MRHTSGFGVMVLLIGALITGCVDSGEPNGVVWPWDAETQPEGCGDTPVEERWTDAKSAKSALEMTSSSWQPDKLTLEISEALQRAANASCELRWQRNGTSRQDTDLPDMHLLWVVTDWFEGGGSCISVDLSTQTDALKVHCESAAQLLYRARYLEDFAAAGYESLGLRVRMGLVRWLQKSNTTVSQLPIMHKYILPHPGDMEFFGEIAAVDASATKFLHTITYSLSIDGSSQKAVIGICRNRRDLMVCGALDNSENRSVSSGALKFKEESSALDNVLLWAFQPTDLEYSDFNILLSTKKVNDWSKPGAKFEPAYLGPPFGVIDAAVVLLTRTIIL